MVGASTSYMRGAICGLAPTEVAKPKITQRVLRHKRYEESTGVLTIPAGYEKVVVRNMGPLVNHAVISKIDVMHGVDGMSIDVDGQHTYEPLRDAMNCIEAPLQEIIITTNDSTVWVDAYYYE